MGDVLGPEAAAYLETVRIPLRLACTTESGWPAAVSLWFVYQDGALYCATQESARVVAYLRQDERCAFEVAADEPPYCGLRGQARASIEPARGPEILVRLLERYLGGTDSPLAQKLLARRASEVAIRLDPVNAFTWNFARRMEGSLPGANEKPCPPA